MCLKQEYTISISLFTYVHLTLGRVGTSPATPKTVCKQGTFCIAQLVSLNTQLWWVNTLTLQAQLLNRILQQQSAPAPAKGLLSPHIAFHIPEVRI